MQSKVISTINKHSNVNTNKVKTYRIEPNKGNIAQASAIPAQEMQQKGKAYASTKDWN